MIEKHIAINILEDIQNSLMQKNWKEESLKNIDLYRKGLEIATSPKIKNLVKNTRNILKNTEKMTRKH